jgi:hypothetical protein
VYHTRTDTQSIRTHANVQSTNAGVQTHMHQSPHLTSVPESVSNFLQYSGYELWFYLIFVPSVCVIPSAVKEEDSCSGSGPHNESPWETVIFSSLSPFFEGSNTAAHNRSHLPAFQVSICRPLLLFSVRSTIWGRTCATCTVL